MIDILSKLFSRKRKEPSNREVKETKRFLRTLERNCVIRWRSTFGPTDDQIVEWLMERPEQPEIAPYDPRLGL